MPKRQSSAKSSRPVARRVDSGAPLTIGELAAASGTTLRTVRFYEEEGLLSTSPRTEGRHRRYDSAELSRLRALLELRSAGLSLEQIRALMGVRSRHVRGSSASRELGEALGAQIEVLQTRLKVLRRVKGEFEVAQERLSECADCHDDARYVRQCEGCETLLRSRAKSPFLRLLWSGKP